jgi:hypothetical protein
MTNSLYTFGQQLPSGVTGQSQIQNIGGNSYPARGAFGEKERTKNFIEFASTVIPSGAVESKVAGLFNKTTNKILIGLEERLVEEAAQQTMVSVKDKLARYLLNADHPIGGAKAKWFEKALGFTQKNSDDLAKQIVFDAEKAVQTEVTKYGTKYNQTIEITGANNKRIDVVFSWIKDAGDGVVRLVTAIPTKK